MYIQLRLSGHNATIFMPDGYVNNANKLREDFLTWCYEQKEAYTFPMGKNYAVRITSDLFLRFLNEDILGDVNEVAYYVSEKCPPKAKTKTLVF